MPYSEGIGGENAKLFFAGSEKTYNRCFPFLRCRGGDLRHLGPNTKGAAAPDMAFSLMISAATLALSMVHIYANQKTLAWVSLQQCFPKAAKQESP